MPFELKHNHKDANEQMENYGKQNKPTKISWESMMERDEKKRNKYLKIDLSKGNIINMLNSSVKKMNDCS